MWSDCTTMSKMPPDSLLSIRWKHPLKIFATVWDSVTLNQMQSWLTDIGVKWGWEITFMLEQCMSKIEKASVSTWYHMLLSCNTCESIYKISRASETVQCIYVRTAAVWWLGFRKWMERTNSGKLPSYFYTQSVMCIHIHVCMPSTHWHTYIINRIF